MVRLCWKPARLAVRILCLSYLAQKLSPRERERERKEGWKEKENGLAVARILPSERRDSVGRLTVAKVPPVKERAVVFFDELVAGLNSGMQRASRNGMKRATRQTQKSEVRFPGTIPLVPAFSRISFSTFYNFYAKSYVKIYMWYQVYLLWLQDIKFIQLIELVSYHFLSL